MGWFKSYLTGVQNKGGVGGVKATFGQCPKERRFFYGFPKLLTNSLYEPHKPPLYFWIYIFIAQRRSQKTTNTFFTVVTGWNPLLGAGWDLDIHFISMCPHIVVTYSICYTLEQHSLSQWYTLNCFTLVSRELKQDITSLTITSPSLHHHFIFTSLFCLFIYALWLGLSYYQQI